MDINIKLGPATRILEIAKELLREKDEKDHMNDEEFVKNEEKKETVVDSLTRRARQILRLHFW